MHNAFTIPPGDKLTFRFRKETYNFYIHKVLTEK